MPAGTPGAVARGMLVAAAAERGVPSAPELKDTSTVRLTGQRGRRLPFATSVGT